MEIQYKRFHQLMNINDLLDGLHPLRVIGEANLTQYINGTKPTITHTKEIEINEKLDRIEFAMDLVHEVEKEIDINLVNLTTSGNATPYISYLRRNHQNALINIKELFHYEWIKSSKIDFDAWTEKHPEDTQSSKETRPITNFERLTSLEPGMGIAFDDDGKVISFSISVHTDPISRYLSMCMAFIGIYEQLGPFIEQASNPKSASADAKNDVFSDWRLVIPDPNRRIAYDKWTGVLRKIRRTIDDHSEAITNINNTAYKSGNGNKNYDEFIAWGSELTTSIVPDRIFSHEILQEVDVNLIELRTQREKDLYLFKLKNELDACVSLFRGCMKTHPDYRARELDATYNEATEQFVYTESHPEVLVDDWRKMFKEKEKYSLQSFYIHLLVIIEVLEKIIDYIEGRMSPQEKGRLDAHSATSKGALTSDRHKLILLHKLGLFEILKDRYMNPNQPEMLLEDFAELIAVLIDAKSDNFRSEVGKLKNEIDAPKKPKLVQTPSAIKKVNSFLASIGLQH
jgi:hypothetical protein